MLHPTILPNGLRILAINVPGTNAITTLILAGAGSRYETLSNSGISHFLEHMFFKGSEKYKTPKDVSIAVDSFGGAFNAFTGKEYAGYYIKSNKENYEKSLDILSDMLLQPTFPVKEIEKERGVILEEMAMYLDAPMYQISWDFERLVFGDQPLGRDQIGTKELINTVSQKDFKNYQDQLYTPDNILIVVAGNIPDNTSDLIVSYFDFPQTKKAFEPDPFIPDNGNDSIYVRTKNTEQFHICLGVESVAEKHPDFCASVVLSTILGGNMSSRMFQSLREEQSLCYSVRTRIDEYSDAGLMVTQAGVKKDKVLDAIIAIRDQYFDIAQNGITEEELTRAHNYLCGKLDLSTEDTEEVAHQYGHDYLLYGHLDTFEEQKEKYKAVTKADVENLAKKLFVPQNLRLSGIGPSIDMSALEDILRP